MHDMWAKVVRRVDGEGTAVTVAQYQAIITYLTRNYGPERLNINDASAEDIAVFSGQSDSDPDLVVKYRAPNGNNKNNGGSRKKASTRRRSKQKNAVGF